MIRILENKDKEAVSVDTLDIMLRVVPDRVRTLLPGMIVLETVAKYFGSESIEVTNAGVRDGFLYKYVVPEALKEEKKDEKAEKKTKKKGKA